MWASKKIFWVVNGVWWRWLCGSQIFWEVDGVCLLIRDTIRKRSKKITKLQEWKLFGCRWGLREFQLTASWRKQRLWRIVGHRHGIQSLSSPWQYQNWHLYALKSKKRNTWKMTSKASLASQSLSWRVGTDASNCWTKKAFHWQVCECCFIFSWTPQSHYDEENKQKLKTISSSLPTNKTCCNQSFLIMVDFFVPHIIRKL